MKKIISALVICVSLSASAEYNPEGKEIFAFNDLAESLQKYGYENFCKEPIKYCSILDNLKYDKYNGMKGYFDTGESVSTSFSSYAVTLENNEKFYYAPSLGKIYGTLSQILPAEKYDEYKNFKEVSLVPNSKLKIISKQESNGSVSYKLSNGTLLSESNVSNIRDISKNFNNNAEIAELLTTLRMDKDEMENEYSILLYGSDYTGIQLYIKVKDNINSIRFKATYVSNDWLFVDSFKVAADDYRWLSPSRDFIRDQVNGRIQEWRNVSATEEHLDVAKKLAYSKKSIIRFNGNKYYNDVTLTDEDKVNLRKMIKLNNLMNANK